MTVFGSPDASLKLWNNYRKVLYHYYDKWYDFAELVRNGVGLEQREYLLDTIIPSNYTHKDYKLIKQNPIFQEFSWVPTAEVPLVAPPEVWFYVCGATNVFKKISVYRPGVFPDYLEDSESDFVVMMPHLKGLMGRDKGSIILRKRACTLAFASHLNIIVHTRSMNKLKLDIALDVCRYSPADTVEIFENKIFIHVKSDCMHTLFNARFYRKDNKKVKYKGRIYEAASEASPKLKLTEYKK